MDYFETLEAIVTKKEVIREIKLHSLDPDDFFKDVGIKDEYEGSEVLNWLGY